MNTSQYTIRGIPNSILKRVESESKRTSRSKNDILLSAITSSLSGSASTKDKGSWLDKYLGTLSDEDAKIMREASRASRKIHPKDYK